MKVCFLNHNLRESSGAGRFALALVTNLKKFNPALQAVVLTTSGCHHPWEQPILPSHPLRFLPALARVRKMFRRSDLIHALDGWPYGVIAALANLALGKPLLITAIGTGAIQPLYRRYGWLLAWAYRRANRVVAISDYTRREVVKKVAGLEIDVINHAVSSEEFERPLWDGVAAGDRARIEGWRPFILSVGSPKARKGFTVSIRAFAEIVPQRPELRYVMVGSGGPAIRGLVRELGLEDRVVMVKHVPRPFLVGLYRNAELFMLLPYDVDKDVEGFGFVFLEAAAAGLPVIGTRESGAEDALSHGENGFLVPPQDPPAAAEAAIRILSSPELKERFSRASLAFAREMNWERVAAAYHHIYRSLLREHL